MIEVTSRQDDPATGLGGPERVPNLIDTATIVLEPGQSGFFWDVDLGRYAHFIKPIHVGALIAVGSAVVQILLVAVGVSPVVDLTAIGGSV